MCTYFFYLLLMFFQNDWSFEDSQKNATVTEFLFSAGESAISICRMLVNVYVNTDLDLNAVGDVLVSFDHHREKRKILFSARPLSDRPSACCKLGWNQTDLISPERRFNIEKLYESFQVSDDRTCRLG